MNIQERCPICRARLSENMVCTRCEADLTLVRTAWQKSDYWLQASIQHLIDQDWQIAEDYAANALSYHRSPLAVSTWQFIRQNRYLPT